MKYLTPLSLFIILFPFLVFSNNTSDELFFNVYRNDSKIGYHKLKIQNNKNTISSEIEIKFEVTFLGFVLYDYYHFNSEQWKENTLISMVAQTNKNGDELFCNLEKKDDSFFINGSIGNKFLDKKITPTTYWKFDQLITGEKNKIVLNSQDCSFIEFKIENLGKEKIYDSVIANHFKLTGKEVTGDDVNIDIWYHKERWIKMIFLKDGSKIEYFLAEHDTEEK